MFRTQMDWWLHFGGLHVVGGTFADPKMDAHKSIVRRKSVEKFSRTIGQKQGN